MGLSPPFICDRGRTGGQFAPDLACPAHPWTDEQERRLEIRFSGQAFRFNGALADVERRITVRLGAIMIGSVGALSALRLL